MQKYYRRSAGCNIRRGYSENREAVRHTLPYQYRMISREAELYCIVEEITSIYAKDP